MAGTPADFKKDLRRFDEKLDRVLVLVHVETTKSVRLRVATKTPILTGRASGSWNASIGSPNFSPKPEGYRNPSGAPTDGTVSLLGYRLGQKTHVSNGVGYIGALNMGSSNKAPAGFVEATVAEIDSAMAGIVQQVRARVRV